MYDEHNRTTVNNIGIRFVQIFPEVRQEANYGFTKGLFRRLTVTE